MFGGSKETRTLDPLNANQVLSQLSYRPIKPILKIGNKYHTHFLIKIQHFHEQSKNWLKKGPISWESTRLLERKSFSNKI